MLNNILFIFSCGFVVLFALFCYRHGKETLIAWIALQGVIANLFVLKQINLMGLNATASDLFAIGSLLGLNLLQEKYGKEISHKAVKISFICMLFFCVVSQIHLAYVPSQHDTAHLYYQQLLGPAPRIMLASVAVFYVVQRFDVFFYGMLRKQFCQNSVIFLNTCSLLVSQFLDTVLFSFFGLFGLVDAIAEIILISYCIKVTVIFCTVPFSHFSRRYIVVQDG